MLGHVAFRNLSRRSNVYAVAWDVVHGFLSHNCVHLAAAISYYSLFSLFPLALAVISVMGFILQRDEAAGQVTLLIGGFLPVSQELVTNTIRGVVNARGAAGALATVGLFWASMAVFSAIRKGINAAWGILQPRPFLHDRLIDLSLMAGAGFLFLASLAATSTLGFARALSILFYGEVLADGLFPWDFLARTIAPSLTFLTFLFLYRFLPNARVTLRDVWPGALIATVAFEIVKNIFVFYYAQNVATFNLVYGGLATIVALLLWAYISALILLVGAAIAAACQRVWGAGVPLEADAFRVYRNGGVINGVSATGASTNGAAVDSLTHDAPTGVGGA